MYVRPTNSQLGLAPETYAAIAQTASGFLSNVFGSNNRPAIQDIEAALEMGETISAESWAAAGLPSDGGDWYRQWKLRRGIFTPDMANPMNVPGMAYGAIGGLSLSNPIVLGALALGAWFVLKRVL